MDYHIVPNLTDEKQNVKRRHVHDLHDWHFQATLFGAAMFILLVPLAASLVPSKNNDQVLGATSQQIISNKTYDSESGYSELGTTNASDKENLINTFVNSLLSVFK